MQPSKIRMFVHKNILPSLPPTHPHIHTRAHAHSHARTHNILHSTSVIPFPSYTDFNSQHGLGCGMVCGSLSVWEKGLAQVSTPLFRYLSAHLMLLLCAHAWICGYGVWCVCVCMCVCDCGSMLVFVCVSFMFHLISSPLPSSFMKPSPLHPRSHDSTAKDTPNGAAASH
jgi:hypothetical protein